MMIATFLVLAAAAPQAPSAPAFGETAPAVSSAILEMTYDAFVAVEESPRLDEMMRPAIFIRTGQPRAIIGASAAVPIS